MCNGLGVYYIPVKILLREKKEGGIERGERWRDKRRREGEEMEGRRKEEREKKGGEIRGMEKQGRQEGTLSWNSEGKERVHLRIFCS